MSRGAPESGPGPVQSAAIHRAMIHDPAITPAAFVAPSAYPPIQDYGVIGNCRAAALVSRGGSIDWLCVPRFDSPSVFGAILDGHKGGRFVIRPTGPHSVSRSYAGSTNVLRTEFRAERGVLAVTDLMPVTTEQRKRTQLWPDHEVLRIVECTQGEVEAELLCDPRPGYGSVTPEVRRAGFPGWAFIAGAQTLLLVSQIETKPIGYRPGVYGRTRLSAGDRRTVSLAFSADRPAVLPVPGAPAMDRLGQSLAWWESWAGRCRYQGPHRAAVVRSALALKLMCYAPSGAVIASPTTSLPEAAGGDQNWDYRYCWLRDASFTIRALIELGYMEEASAFISWLLHATRLTWPRLSVLYDVYGESRIPERELPLEGYRGSRPVRIGNDAHRQLQLDVYGALVDAAYRFTRAGGELDRAASKMLAGIGRSAATLWAQPDEGIWEPRTGRRHHTLSKAMCWVALDRLQSLGYEGRVRIDRDGFRRTARHIRAEIEARGFSRRLGSYTAEFDSERLDASLLLLALYGYAEPRSGRMRSTVDRILGTLSSGPLVYRFRDPEQVPSRAGEGAFGLCGYWAVECLALRGDTGAAHERFGRLLSYANDLGLFAEEIDPATGAAAGNFPQAFTHVGVINAAHTLVQETRTGRRDTGAPPARETPGRSAAPVSNGQASDSTRPTVPASPGRSEPATPAPDAHTATETEP
jgi:GH15 family glucan-1,4-alpha-glucosidase